MSSPPKAAVHPWAVKLASDGKQQGLPIEKIRQKLVLEGVEAELITPVLEAISTPRCLSAGSADEEEDGPICPLSPHLRQPSARRFHDMLSQGLPAASVRQKMAMEGCPPEDINTFFASETGDATTVGEP